MMIRPAVQKDAANIAALAIQVWLHTYATEGVQSAISEYVLGEFTPDRIRAIVENPSKIMLVAEVGGHLVGYAVIVLNSVCAAMPEVKVELDKLYVQEHFHGRGIGRSLLRASVDSARDRDAEGLWLRVYHGNAKAIGFYSHEG